MTSASSVLTPKTVFIVGAGASSEANLPVGSELKKLIAKALDIRFERGIRTRSGDDTILQALRSVAESGNPTSDVNALLEAGWSIRDAMPQAMSIDNYLDAHNNDSQVELCGKLAIVQRILEAERKSNLYVDHARSNRDLNHGAIETTWFNRFFQQIAENCRRSDLESRLKAVALVIFNYDRCIEHYLYHAFRNYYKMSEPDAASLLQHLEVFHPYGTVGPLPWTGADRAIGFGEEPSHTQLRQLAGQIKTFTEGTDTKSSEINAIRLNMKTAGRLVFLGFAFHPLNVELLLPRDEPPQGLTGRRVFATGYGISANDAQVITDELAVRATIQPASIKIGTGLKCTELFEEYRRSLSFV